MNGSDRVEESRWSVAARWNTMEKVIFPKLANTIKMRLQEGGVAMGCIRKNICKSRPRCFGPVKSAADAGHAVPWRYVFLHASWCHACPFLQVLALPYLWAAWKRGKGCPARAAVVVTFKMVGAFFIYSLNIFQDALPHSLVFLAIFGTFCLTQANVLYGFRCCASFCHVVILFRHFSSKSAILFWDHR